MQAKTIPFFVLSIVVLGGLEFGAQAFGYWGVGIKVQLSGFAVFKLWFGTILIGDQTKIGTKPMELSTLPHINPRNKVEVFITATQHPAVIESPPHASQEIPSGVHSLVVECSLGPLCGIELSIAKFTCEMLVGGADVSCPTGSGSRNNESLMKYM